MSVILSFAGWTIVPDLASGFIHNALQRVLGSSIAVPGTKQYVRDRKVIHVLVVLSYLAYTLATAYAAVEPNFYNLLGVSHDADEKQLRRAFRKFSTTHHPDKGGDETIFRTLRVAYDTLSDTSLRFAYDRFGAQVIAWPRFGSLHEYVYSGLKGQMPFYIQSILFISVLGYFQQSAGMYQRILTLTALACVSLMVVTSAEILPVFRVLVPDMVQFQQISLLQSCCITLLVAIAQSGPVLFPPTRDSMSNDALLETAAMANLCHAEVSQTLQMTHLPFAHGNTKTLDLYTKTAAWMVQARIDQDPEVLAVKQELLKPRQVS